MNLAKPGLLTAAGSDLLAGGGLVWDAGPRPFFRFYEGLDGEAVGGWVWFDSLLLLRGEGRARLQSDVTLVVSAGMVSRLCRYFHMAQALLVFCLAEAGINRPSLPEDEEGAGLEVPP